MVHYEGVKDEDPECIHDLRKIIQQTKQKFVYRYKNLINLYNFRCLLQGDCKFLWSVRKWLSTKSDFGNGWLLTFNHPTYPYHMIQWKDWYSFMKDFRLKDIIIDINILELNQMLINNNNNNNNVKNTILVLNNTQINNYFFGNHIESLINRDNFDTEQKYIAYCKETALKNHQTQYGIALEGSIEGTFSLLHCKKSLCSLLCEKQINFILIKSKINGSNIFMEWTNYALPSLDNDMTKWKKVNFDEKNQVIKNQPKSIKLSSLNKRESVFMLTKIVLFLNEISQYTQSNYVRIKISSYMVINLKIVKMLFYCHRPVLSNHELKKCYQLFDNFRDYCCEFHRELVGLFLFFYV